MCAMSYIVFARKYRPQTFDDIVGQPHITTTLKNAISQGRVAHAYLFAGPRGVGKTTTARIFAKALNCEKGPISKPCGSCAACKEISQGTSLDVLEIDGASNRGIDEIRNLRENVKFSPSKGKFKVYIIDEVHMLTAEAFNALLKTLEEPPRHVKFIFATTQGHKVPQTILSRCQRFDFKRITTKDAFENLKYIAREEKLNVPDEAISLIAKHSDGSMRDAQVILDQIASFAQGRIGLEDVNRILGIINEEILFGLSRSITERDSKLALKIINDFINEGKDVFSVVLSLIEHFRNLAVTKITTDADSLVDLGSDRIIRYKDEAKKFTIEEILYIIYTFSNTIDFIRKSNISRIPFEAAMVKLTLSSPIVSLDEIMDRIDRLGKSQKPETSPPWQERKAGQRPEAVDHRPITEDKGETKKVESAADMDEVLSSWTSVINYAKAKKISIGSYLQEGYPVNVDAKTITIGFPKECQFHKEVLDSPDNRRLIEEAISAALHTELKAVLTLVEPVDVRHPLQDVYIEKDVSNEDSIEKGETAKKEIDPIVKTALDIFNGEIANRPTDRGRTK